MYVYRETSAIRVKFKVSYTSIFTNLAQSVKKKLKKEEASSHFTMNDIRHEVSHGTQLNT